MKRPTSQPELPQFDLVRRQGEIRGLNFRIAETVHAGLSIQ